MPSPDSYRETRDVPVADLRPFPGNANRGDIPAIRESIRQTGQYRPLIVRQQDDGQLVVLAGNNTLVALRAEGCAAVRCEIHVMDDRAALRVNIGDNQIARRAVTDEDLLLEQLSFLDGDYAGTGLTQGHVNALLGESGWAVDPEHETDGLTADDLAAPETQPAGHPGPGGAVLLTVPPHHAAFVLGGLDVLGEQYGTDSPADTLVHLIGDALGTHPSSP